MLEEMPPFPERESSILAKLKKKKGSGTRTEVDESRKERNANVNGNSTEHTTASTNAKVGFFRFRVYFVSSFIFYIFGGNYQLFSLSQSVLLIL